MVRLRKCAAALSSPVSLWRYRGGSHGAFEPLQNVLPQSRLVVVDEHRCRDMHCAHQDKAFTHLTRLDLLRHLVGDIDDLLTPLRVEPEIVGAGLHQSPVSNCHSQTESLNWPQIWRFHSGGESSSSSS